MSAEAEINGSYHPSLTFGEVGDDRLHELQHLFHKEWEEVGHARDTLELDIDYAVLTALLVHKRAAVFVVLSEQEIVGYKIYTVGPHPKYRGTTWAFGNGFWIDPDYRLPRVAHRLVGMAEIALRERGVEHIQDGSRIAYPAAGRLLKSLGYEAYEIGWYKRL